MPELSFIFLTSIVAFNIPSLAQTTVSTFVGVISIPSACPKSQNEHIALILWSSGYLTPQYVINAPRDELLMIEGIDEEVIKKIKD